MRTSLTKIAKKDDDNGDLDDDMQAQIVAMVSHIIAFKDKMLSC